MGRFKFVLSRPIQLIPVLFGISIVTFVMVHSIPGDPIRTLLGSTSSPEAIERIRAKFGLGFPIFWLGIMLMIVFSVWLGLFPVSGFGEGFFGHLHSLFLPSFAVALALSAVLTRDLRANLLAELDSDHISTARAKGLPARWIFVRHVFRNSLIPTINLLGVNLGWLIGGTVVVESAFSVPGLGSLLVQSIFSRDYTIVQMITSVFACATVLINFPVDIATVAFAPRIKL